MRLIHLNINTKQVLLTDVAEPITTEFSWEQADVGTMRTADKWPL